MSEQQLGAQTTQSQKQSILRDWVIVIALALIIAVVVRVFILQQFYISGPSMETTLFQDNRVLVSKLTYRFWDIRRGDVVVFDRATTEGSSVQHDDLIKRVIGLPGESVEIKNCVVYINGDALREPYLEASDLGQAIAENRCGIPMLEVQIVPTGDVFVMGDNRAQSYDSRMFGPINEDLIVGRAFILVWPLSAAKIL